MPRGQLTKQEMEIIILKYKNELYYEHVDHNTDPKGLAQKYMNLILDKMSEFAR